MTVVIASEDVGSASASPAQLRFDAGNWSTPQTVTVTGVHDDGGEDASTVLQVLAKGALTEVDSLQVVVRDDERLVVSESMLQVREGQSTSFTAQLNSPSSQGVTVDLSSSNPSKASFSPNRLRFTALNWNLPQSVTVTPIQDIDSDSENIEIALRASGGSYTGIENQVQIAVEDDEGPKLLLSSESLSVEEGGASADFNVRLRTRPSSGVTVSVESGDRSAATASPSTLTFSRDNWFSAQTVTVSPVSGRGPRR